MATFTLFQALPFEIQILIFRYYLPYWEFSLTVSQSPVIPANFRIGTGCPFNFIFAAAGRRDDLCALWTSPDLHESARKALEQSFTGEVRLFTLGNWHYPQRKPMFNAFVLPRLPARMIKKLTFCIDEPGGKAPRPTPESYLGWKQLIDFVDFGKMPNLECLSIQVSYLGNLDFAINQIGDVLRGEHDEKVTEWLRRIMPKIRQDQQQQITTPSGGALTIQVFTHDWIHSWVPAWKTMFPVGSKTVIVS